MGNSEEEGDLESQDMGVEVQTKKNSPSVTWGNGYFLEPHNTSKQ